MKKIAQITLRKLNLFPNIAKSYKDESVPKYLKNFVWSAVAQSVARQPWNLAIRVRSPWWAKTFSYLQRHLGYLKIGGTKIWRLTYKRYNLAPLAIYESTLIYSSYFVWPSSLSNRYEKTFWQKPYITNITYTSNSQKLRQFSRDQDDAIKEVQL